MTDVYDLQPLTIMTKPIINNELSLKISWHGAAAICLHSSPPSIHCCCPPRLTSPQPTHTSSSFGYVSHAVSSTLATVSHTTMQLDLADSTGLACEPRKGGACQGVCKVISSVFNSQLYWVDLLGRLHVSFSHSI